MFEKDANLHASIMAWDEDVDTWETIAERSFKDGAEFGYNKANEWHYPSKGEYPKDNSFVLVWTENGGITTNYGKEYSDGIPENGLFEGIHISDVIAWKEIVLPELKESK